MTNTHNELLGLAERVKGATGPDRELDFLVWAAFNGVTEITYPTEGHPMTPGRGGRVEGRGPDGKWHLYGWIDPGQVARNWSPYGGDTAYPPVTSSLDAAMSLVPEGYGWTLCNYDHVYGGNEDREGHVWLGRDIQNLKAATPALALLASCLRAHASLREGNNR